MLSRFVRRYVATPFTCTFVLAGLSLLADVRDAQACGGCFHQPPPTNEPDSTVVTDHRMAFSLSQAQTVLWDQVRYSGSPNEFAWVLPVKTGAEIEISQDSWIASLDASTQTIIQGPTPSCGSAPVQGGGGCGFSSSSSPEDFAGSAAEEDSGVVQVVSESVVGPYDAVTVRSSQGQALGDWLRANGYAVPDAIQPVIDAFTDDGFDFIALKLRPGEGVQAMQPVRIITPGADPSLPLRMVAAGVGANVGIELFVLSEGRYQPQNFPQATIDFTQLVWDPYNNISNYETLAAAAMAANGGASWLTESSGPADVTSPYYGYSYGSSNPPLAGTYTYTCTPLTLPPPANCGEAGNDGGDETSAASDAAVDGARPVPEASVLEASVPPTSPPLFADGGSCASTTVPCDDLMLAMTGIAGGNLWVTRLRAFLPATALANDLVIEASPSQEEVPSFHETSTYSDPNYNPCPNGASGSSGGGSCACRTTEVPRRHLGDVFVVGLGAVLVGLSLRRRRR